LNVVARLSLVKLSSLQGVQDTSVIAAIQTFLKASHLEYLQFDRLLDGAINDAGEVGDKEENQIFAI